MKPLSYYISHNPKYDSHIHLFDAHGASRLITDHGVGFPDIEVRTAPELYDESHLLEMYAKYINEFPGYDILATALDPYTAIKIQQRFNLKGFGELKCYSEAGNNGVIKKLPYKSENYWKPLFDYANERKLPIWIHWSLLDTTDYWKLRSIIKHYPKIKFVICHCGIDAEDIMDRAGTTAAECFERCLSLLKEFANAYCDVSWTASKFLLDNPQYNLPSNKYVIGSDINPKLCRGEESTQFSPVFKDYEDAAYCFVKINSKLNSPNINIL